LNQPADELKLKRGVGHVTQDANAELLLLVLEVEGVCPDKQCRTAMVTLVDSACKYQTT
jgi:hypothetical protein